LLPNQGGYLFPAGNYSIQSPGVKIRSLKDSRDYVIALIYNGNQWFIDSGTGVAQQITTDRLIERIDWR
jgi:hypothetical protein